MIIIKAQFTEFGLRVKQELARRRLTQTWLAEKMEVSNAYVTNILLGVSCPDERIQQIKELLWNDKDGGREVTKES